MKLLLQVIAAIIFIVIIIIVFMLLTRTTSFKIPDVIKKKVDTIIQKPINIVDNKITNLTPKQISQNAIDLFNYKHDTFLKNLDNSIEFCLNSKKFLLADHILQYKTTYLELYQIKLELEKNNPPNTIIDFNKNEQFLLKSIKLDNLNNLILTTN